MFIRYRYKLIFLYLVSHVLWFQSRQIQESGLEGSQEITSFPLPETKKVIFYYNARNTDHGVTAIKWKTHVLSDCPMKVVFRIFTESLGESESAFAFHLGKDKKR
jgi:hypothetical protein